MSAENKRIEQHNEMQLQKNSAPLIVIPKHINLTQSQIEEIKEKKLSQKGKLSYLLSLKIGCQVMLTANVNIEDNSK